MKVGYTIKQRNQPIPLNLVWQKNKIVERWPIIELQARLKGKKYVIISWTPQAFNLNDIFWSFNVDQTHWQLPARLTFNLDFLDEGTENETEEKKNIQTVRYLPTLTVKE